MGTYFETDEKRKAKNWDMLEQGKEQKAELARFRHEIREVAASLRMLSDALDDWELNTFRVEEPDITVLRIHSDLAQPGRTLPSTIIASVPSSHVNLDQLKRLLAAAESTKRSLAVTVRELGDLGVIL